MMRPAKRVRGHLSGLPGDKSVSHRAAILAALARGRTRISNYATGADCASTLRCLEQLGATIVREEADHGSVIVVEGTAGTLREPIGPLDCGNSGTTMRLLAGVVAGQPFASTLTGDASLSGRPMSRVVEPLELMGARIASEGGHAPLRVSGRSPLAPLEYEMPVASAQVKSCVLMAGLFAEGRTTVVERARTRDHTERMLRWFGACVEIAERTREDGTAEFVASVEGPDVFAGRDVAVPGDISSAAFLVAAAALLPGSDLTIEGVGLNPTRTAFVTTLAMFGADVSSEVESEICNEPRGRLRVRGAERAPAPKVAALPPLVLNGHAIAQLIDELPLLAVLGTQVPGGIEIREARELRAKESDRISATVENLRAMGAEVEEYDDGLRVRGAAPLRGAQLDAYGDHRIAMAFAVAALLAEDETEIGGAEECVGISFPGFFELLESVVER